MDLRLPFRSCVHSLGIGFHRSRLRPFSAFFLLWLVWLRMLFALLLFMRTRR